MRHASSRSVRRFGIVSLVLIPLFLGLASGAGAAMVTLDPGPQSSDLVVRTDDGGATPAEDHQTPVGLPYATPQEVIVGASRSEGDPRLSHGGFRLLFSQEVGPAVGAMAEARGEVYFAVSQPVVYTIAGGYDLAGYLDEALLSAQIYDVTDDVVVYESLQHGMAVSFPTTQYYLGGTEGDFDNVLIGDSTGTLEPGHVYRLRYTALKRRLTVSVAQAQAQGGEVQIKLQQVVDNGLAPPSPTNVIAEKTGLVWVSNQGCGIDLSGTCPSQIPTEVAVRDGASSDYFYEGVQQGIRVGGDSLLRVQGGALDAGAYAYHDARILITGGSHTVDRFRAIDDASVVVRGGFCKLQAQEQGELWVEGGAVGQLSTFGDARATIRGGDVTGILTIHGSTGSSGSLLEVYGTDFTVDGSPVPYGPVAATSGQLAGRLPRGGAIDASFSRALQGEIVLVEAPPVPLLGPVAGAGLFALLAASGCRRGRGLGRSAGRRRARGPQES